MEKEEINFGSSVDELLKGLEGFVSSKTVVGEPIQGIAGAKVRRRILFAKYSP